MRLAPWHEEIEVVPYAPELWTEYRRGLIDLVSEADFCFRTLGPLVRNEFAVSRLLMKDRTQILLRGKKPVGIWSAWYANYAGAIYNLAFRISRSETPSSAGAILDGMVQQFRCLRPMRSMFYRTLESDDWGLSVLRHSTLFRDVGLLERARLLNGRLQGIRYFQLTEADPHD